MVRILLVEDEFLIRMPLAEELMDAGYEVTEANNGDEALEFVGRGDGFDILITDIHMPGTVDGVELASSMRKLEPDILVLYVTGQPEALASMGHLATKDALLRKPFDGPDVIQAVTILLEAQGQSHDADSTRPSGQVARQVS
jgi:CheY-like chemotaxis protein